MIPQRGFGLALPSQVGSVAAHEALAGQSPCFSSVLRNWVVGPAGLAQEHILPGVRGGRTGWAGGRRFLPTLCSGPPDPELVSVGLFYDAG